MVKDRFDLIIGLDVFGVEDLVVDGDVIVIKVGEGVGFIWLIEL